MNTKEKLLVEGQAIFNRIFMKYESFEKEPLDLGNGDKLYGSQIHMIEAIGKEYGKTVTTLSEYFKVTKGATSQIVSKLHKDGYLTRTKQAGNDKEIILELTKKGWKAFEAHEGLNEAAFSDMVRLANKYSEEEIRLFLSMLTEIDSFFGNYAEGK